MALVPLPLITKLMHILRMPILVVSHYPNWQIAFADEAKLIFTSLGHSAIDLHHIGSTSISGILAKPIIDLLGVVPAVDRLESQSSLLETLGYEVMGAYGIEGRHYFRKTDATGNRTHHLHVFESGSPHIERHLAFRDYLIAHPDVAMEYSRLKARLAANDTTMRSNYIDGKAPFVEAVQRDALIWARKLE